MNAWPFVFAAYGITALGATGIAWVSWRAMRRAEAQVEALRRK